MVTQLLKFFFEVNTTIPAGLPSFVTVIPDSIQQLYTDYYLVGTGRRVLQIILTSITVYAVFGKSIYGKWFARFVIILTCLLWSKAETMIVINTIVPLNILSLPIPKIPTSIFLIVVLLAFGFSYQHFHVLLQKHCNRAVVLFCDLSVCFLVALLSLPIWSGELWYL